MNAELRIGSLCTGYGGLDMAAHAAFGQVGPVRTAWVADNAPGPAKILAHRFPGMPNLGDLTTVDWATVEAVDVLTAGFPCQPVSHAGKRLGADDERWLWDDVARAVRELRPDYVILENVRGLLTAKAGGRPGGLFARVLGTLAGLGYDVIWHCLPASDVGAPHKRIRIFIVAADTRSEVGKLGSGLRTDEPARDGRRQSSRDRRAALLPTPTTRDHKGRNQRDDDSCLTGALLPTPAVNDMGAGKTVAAWDAWTADMQAKHGNGNGHGKSLSIEAQRLLPTPRTKNNENRQSEAFAHGEHGGNFHRRITGESQWGDYAAAIERWEAITRPAPAPTVPDGRNGAHRLSPRFVEWMMGLPPEGWVTEVPGLSRSEQLKALGNGVVPQQAAAAIRWCLAQLARIEVAA